MLLICAAGTESTWMTFPVRVKLNVRTSVAPAAVSRATACVDDVPLATDDAYVTASLPGSETAGRVVRSPLMRRVASAPAEATRALDAGLRFASLVGHVYAVAAFGLMIVPVGAGVGVRVGKGVGVAVARGATDPPPPPPPPHAARHKLVMVRSAKNRDGARSPKRRKARKNGTARARAIIALG